MTTSRMVARAVAAGAAGALLLGPLAGAAVAAPRKTAPPVITAQPPAVTNSQAATFQFSHGTAGATFTCSLDAAAYAACTSPVTYSGLSAGAHRFRVQAKAGTQTVSTATQASWTVDLVAPPAPSLSGVPASPTAATTASIGLADAEAGVTFACAVDAEPAAPCTSPLVLSSLAHGTHKVSVTASDAAGNRSTPTDAVWSVDTEAPPAPSVTTGPAARTNATGATFALASPDATAAVLCSLDGGTLVACESPVVYAGLAEGVHTLDVVARDAAGNSTSAPRYSWTVDLTAPTPPSVLTGPAPITSSETATFTFSVPAEAAGLRCALDGGEYAPCATPHDTAALAQGSHTLHVLARDEAGNDSGAVAYNWTVDSAPPPAPTVTGPPSLTRVTSATFSINSAEPHVRFTCALDGASATACESGTTYAGPLANGAHSLVVTAYDAVGNAAATTYTWTVDATAPTVVVKAPTTLNGPALASFSEPVAGVSAQSLAIKLSTSSSALAATLACFDAASAPVSCSTGAVRAARVQPTRALVAGERYAVSVGAAILDAAGNPMAARSVAFRAQTTVQNDAVGATYAWRAVPTTAAHGGSYRTERLAGAAVTYTFSGTSLTWYTTTGPRFGKADVYVDGVRRATVNNYASAMRYRVARTLTGLAPGAHTLRIVVLGARGSSAGTGTEVAVDAVKVGTTLSTSPVLAYSWRTVKLSTPSGVASLSATDLANASTSLTFRGTSVSFWTSTGRNRGKAQIYVDGVLKATYDLYSASTVYNVRRTLTGLTDARHTVKVVVLGAHRAGATGNLVYLDKWTVA